MKIVELCQQGSCCPVVKIDEQQVEIGEKGNTCILTKDEWEVLRQKVINGGDIVQRIRGYWPRFRISSSP